MLPQRRKAYFKEEHCYNKLRSINLRASEQVAFNNSYVMVCCMLALYVYMYIKKQITI
jgi:hypothetical protein